MNALAALAASYGVPATALRLRGSMSPDLPGLDTVQRLRLRCLELALERAAGRDDDGVVDVAAQLEAFALSGHAAALAVSREIAEGRAAARRASREQPQGEQPPGEQSPGTPGRSG